MCGLFSVGSEREVMQFRIRHLLVVVALFACLCWSILGLQHAMTTRPIVSEDLPNGTRVRVIQDFTGEPFNTAIYFDDGDGRWRWYYYDHEDWYWNSANTDFAKGDLFISDNGRSIIISTKTGECFTSGPGLPERTHEKSTKFVNLPVEPQEP